MSLQKELQRLERMHDLIRTKRTGSPDVFATKLGIKRAQLYVLLKQLREMGAPVVYSKLRECYMYYEPVELQLGFVRAGGRPSPPAPAATACVRQLPQIRQVA